MDMLGRVRRLDVPLLLATYGLLAIGVIFIHSSNAASGAPFAQQEYVRQIAWALIGSALLFVVASVNFDFLRRIANPAYVTIIVLLVLTLMFGRVVNGARRWIGIAGMGMQPSEFAKIALVLVLARLLESSGPDIRRLGRLLLLLGITLIPVMLVLIQPDLGTAVSFMPVLIVMALAAGAAVHHLAFFAVTSALTLIIAVLPSVGEHVLPAASNVLGVFAQPGFVAIIAGAFVGVVIVSLLAWMVTRRRMFSWVSFASGIGASSVIGGFIIQQVLRPYQIMRMIVFLDPQIDPRGAGWHTIQSLTAVGSGGFSGKGLFQGTQSQYQYLPLQSTDFIFSILAEEWGFRGALLLFALYGFVLFRGLVIAMRARDQFAALVATGVTTLLAFHFFVNVGMTIGIMPITGIPLWLVSFGGSSLWSAMIGIGLLIGISARSAPPTL